MASLGHPHIGIQEIPLTIQIVNVSSSLYFALDSRVRSRVYAFHMPQGSETVKNTMQIGKAAQRTALTVDTIRFYEHRALLPKALRTTGQFRLYTSDDITRLNFIKQMQSLGFSLQQIKQLLELRDRGRYACEQVSNLLNNKLIEIRRKIRELQKLEGELATDLRKCNRELKARRSRAPRQCPVLTDLEGAK
jgi:DNA-binding transcriptional MerR regulator